MYAEIAVKVYISDVHAYKADVGQRIYYLESVQSIVVHFLLITGKVFFLHYSTYANSLALSGILPDTD